MWDIWHALLTCGGLTLTFLSIEVLDQVNPSLRQMLLQDIVVARLEPVAYPFHKPCALFRHPVERPRVRAVPSFSLDFPQWAASTSR